MGGSPGVAVEPAVLDRRLGSLSPAAVRSFRLLGLHPGPSADAGAVAALAGGCRAEARAALAELARAGLVEEVGGGRFGLPDPLRAYAAAQAGPDAAACRRRLVEHLVTTAGVAAEVGFPAGVPVALPPFPSAAAARAWLEAERPVLLAAAAADPAVAARLAPALAEHLDAGGQHDAALALYERALAAGADPGPVLVRLGTTLRRLGRYPEAEQRYRAALAGSDRGVRTDALHGLGVVCWRTGRYAAAREHLTAALAGQRALGRRADEGRTLSSLGVVARRLGDYPAAVQHHAAAVTVLAAVGDRGGEGRALHNLGVVLSRLGRHPEALERFERCRQLCRQLGDRAGEAAALANIGFCHERQGRAIEALAWHAEAYQLCTRAGYRVGQGDALRGLGAAHGRLGRHTEAVDLLERAVAIGTELAEDDLRTGALNDLGEVLAAAGRTAEALRSHRTALSLAAGSDDRYEHARALAGLGAVLRAAGDPAAAAYQQEAAELFAALGVREAAPVRDTGAVRAGDLLAGAGLGRS